MKQDYDKDECRKRQAIDESYHEYITKNIFLHLVERLYAFPIVCFRVGKNNFNLHILNQRLPIEQFEITVSCI